MGAKCVFYNVFTPGFILSAFSRMACNAYLLVITQPATAAAKYHGHDMVNFVRYLVVIRVPFFNGGFIGGYFAAKHARIGVGCHSVNVILNRWRFSGYDIVNVIAVP